MTTYDYVLLYRTLYDFVCICMSHIECVWLYKTLYKNVWQCMIIHDFVRLSMNINDYVWLFMSRYDSLWLCAYCMNLYKCLWLFMTMFVNVWLCMTLYDHVWVHMTMWDCLWLYMTKYDYLWLCMTMNDYIWSNNLRHVYWTSVKCLGWYKMVQNNSKLIWKDSTQLNFVKICLRNLNLTHLCTNFVLVYMNTAARNWFPVLTSPFFFTCPSCIKI